MQTASPDLRTNRSVDSSTNRRAVMDNARSPLQIPVERQISVNFATTPRPLSHAHRKFKLSNCRTTMRKHCGTSKMLQVRYSYTYRTVPEFSTFRSLATPKTTKNTSCLRHRQATATKKARRVPSDFSRRGSSHTFPATQWDQLCPSGSAIVFRTRRIPNPHQYTTYPTILKGCPRSNSM